LRTLCLTWDIRVFRRGSCPNPVICSTHEKFTAIFIVLLPLHTLHLQPITFARFVRRLVALRHDALEAARSAFSKQLLAVLEGFRVPHTQIVVPAQQGAKLLLPSSGRKSAPLSERLTPVHRYEPACCCLVRR